MSSRTERMRGKAELENALAFSRRALLPGWQKQFASFAGMQSVSKRSRRLHISILERKFYVIMAAYLLNLARHFIKEFEKATHDNPVYTSVKRR